MEGTSQKEYGENLKLKHGPSSLVVDFNAQTDLKKVDQYKIVAKKSVCNCGYKKGFKTAKC